MSEDKLKRKVEKTKDSEGSVKNVFKKGDKFASKQVKKTKQKGANTRKEAELGVVSKKTKQTSKMDGEIGSNKGGKFKSKTKFEKDGKKATTKVVEKNKKGVKTRKEVVKVDGKKIKKTKTKSKEMPSFSKQSGTPSPGKLSYKDSYTDAVASKWESKGGYDAYLKAAKAYNQKKYGTTEPTATAKKAGISKEALANKNTKDVNKTKVEGTMRGSVDNKKKDDSKKLVVKKEVKPIKVKTKQDIAKEAIASGDKKAGKSAGLEGKAKRKANKAGKAQMKAGEAKEKMEDALKKVSERQKEGKSVEGAQAKTARLNDKLKRKTKKAGKKMEKAEESMATYKDAAYMKEDAAYMKDDAAYMKTNQDGGVIDPAAAADQLKGLSAGMMRENPIGYFKQSIKYNVKEASNPSLSASARKHYAENAQHDMKSMAPMHGSMKGDQSASRADYANYKGTDKGYHGKTGSSHGDQSASKADYMSKKKGGSILSKHFKS